MREVAVIEAPSVLGLRPSGVEELPAGAARGRSGRPARGGARRAGSRRRRTTPGGTPTPGSSTRSASRGTPSRWPTRCAGVLDHGRSPWSSAATAVVLLGNLLALRRRGRHGLLFLDGHTDFYQPAAEPTGEVASMELALATGRGPGLLTDLEGRGRWSGTRTSSPSASATPRSPRRPGCSRCRRDCTRSTSTRCVPSARTAAAQAVGRLAADRPGRRVLDPPRRRRAGRRDHARRRLPPARRADLAGAGDACCGPRWPTTGRRPRRHDLQPPPRSRREHRGPPHRVSGAGVPGRPDGGLGQSPWSYTVTAMSRFASRSVTSGSTRDHLPPARPHPMRGMCTEAPSTGTGAPGRLTGGSVSPRGRTPSPRCPASPAAR